ncbi:hypothetical protein Tco_0892153 [Tanacetum coccineum]|uniref:Uncharacterized protein n=1 Tax=Tanacetum coccineum TaxID=301880 RepID=A0ABQ5C895_9ASTR
MKITRLEKLQMQDKIYKAISELKKLIEMFKRKGVDTNFEQPSISGNNCCTINQKSSSWWISTGSYENSCTGKVDSEPAHGSIVDIPHIHACKQTLGLSAETSARMVSQKMSYIKWCLLKITLQAPFLNVQMTSVHISSGLVLHQMTSDHNRSELGIQDHSNEQSV